MAEAARIGRLAKLPVFWALEGKPVLLAGGSDGAAWKAELLAACGAEVHVFAPLETVDACMAALLDMAPGEAGGSLVHHDAHWQEAHFRSFVMAIGDCEDEVEAEAFVAAARQGGIPVNVIDKPAYCQFQFGAIVNRSPVVIGISTDGAAPVLAQAIRRRVEAVLPPTLKGWAALAQGIRSAVNARFSPGAGRRAFWERFTERAFGGGAVTPVEVLIDEIESATAETTVGSLSIVPLSSDDPELLTLKTVRMLQSADLILYDAAVPAAILELGRREARRMPLCNDIDTSGVPASGRIVCLVAGTGSAARIETARRIAARLGLVVSILPVAEVPDGGLSCISDRFAGFSSMLASAS